MSTSAKEKFAQRNAAFVAANPQLQNVTGEVDDLVITFTPSEAGVRSQGTNPDIGVANIKVRITRAFAKLKKGDESKPIGQRAVNFVFEGQIVTPEDNLAGTSFNHLCTASMITDVLGSIWDNTGKLEQMKANTGSAQLNLKQLVGKEYTCQTETEVSQKGESTYYNSKLARFISKAEYEARPGVITPPADHSNRAPSGPGPGSSVAMPFGGPPAGQPAPAPANGAAAPAAKGGVTSFLAEV